MNVYKKIAVFAVTILGFVAGYFVSESLRSEEARVVEAPVIERTVEKAVEPEIEPDPFNEQQIKQAVENHISVTDAEYGIIVLDPSQGQFLAEQAASQTFVSASLYKLYFAFLAWQDVESGDLDLEQNLYQNQSLEECLDLMIRESDSPCGEALLGLYDLAEAQERLEALGLPDINVAGFRTSANDMAKLLQRVVLQQEISRESAASLRQSMEEQIYDKGLKTGFEGLVFQDKVGFSAEGDWHDVGILVLPDGRELIVVVLSRGGGSAGMAELGQVLQQAL